MPYGKAYGFRGGMRTALTSYRRGSRKITWAKKTGLRYSKGMRRMNKYKGQPFGHRKMVNQHVDGTLLALRSFVPPSVVTTHRYVERLSLSNENTTGITGNEIAFRLGSLFDPNFTGAGHQPWGFDQIAAIYQQYQVYKVKVAFRTFSSEGAAAFLAINVRPSVAAYNLQSKFGYEIIERSGNTLIQMDNASGNGTRTEGDIVWQAEYYLADIEGLSRLEYSNDTSYKAYNNTNPVKTPFISVACGSNEPVPGCTVKGHIEIEYFCKWSSPITPGES